ncbi:helix-turn-helix domain-containing protein [Kerstersia gyiorum]|uniref:AraC family transcriptional regulator n=1 Tax=Kerstersia gyiorum TaxID=206506 RepID=A0A4Q7MXE4_9BURK|nr:helix-turn-helix domain-containing protein [Kerstersia gyiorum]MCO7635528.1 helix-turn-helix domain-containing protein [Pseudomonas sp. S 311-6]MCP1632473.1 AraC-like DNA-binding protein [Kerstersia gyiorum]MCP1635021.1 AraC-like DNA-binding protein [Kerstersia gyiorum]MCP1670052.1 AraC-like DNA-binding protein [Kerstersia gyiorum]
MASSPLASRSGTSLLPAAPGQATPTAAHAQRPSGAGTVLSTDGLHAAETAPAWTEWMGQLFHGIESDLYGDASFDGRVATACAGDVVLTRLQANRHRVRRRGSASCRPDADYLKIVAPWQGEAQVEQEGRLARVRPGGWAVYDMTRSYCVSNPQYSDHLIVMVPRAALAERGLALAPLMGRGTGGSGIARVALEAMRSTYQELQHMAPGTASGAGAAIAELVRLSLLEMSGEQTAVSRQEAFRDSVREYIGRHLRDPGLTLDQIALAFGCSKRHLHHAFAGAEQSIAHYIMQRRLQACMRDLRDPAMAGQTITDIAFAWGFSNGAHFSRVFRDHSGLSPTDFRRQAMLS